MAGTIASVNEETGLVRPQAGGNDNLLNPLEQDGGVVERHDESAGSKSQTMEELNKKKHDLEETLIEHWEYNADAGKGEIPTVKTPAVPTEKDWAEHQVTHTPPKFRCKYCLMGRGIRRAHRTNVPDIDAGKWTKQIVY